MANSHLYPSVEAVRDRDFPADTPKSAAHHNGRQTGDRQSGSSPARTQTALVEWGLLLEAGTRLRLKRQALGAYRKFFQVRRTRDGEGDGDGDGGGSRGGEPAEGGGPRLVWPGSSTATA